MKDEGAEHSRLWKILTAYYFEMEAMLLVQIRGILQSTGFSFRPAELDDLALELRQEMILAALAKATTFIPGYQPGAWLLGFVSNLVHQLVKERAQRGEHEVSLDALVMSGSTDPYASGLAAYDRLASLGGAAVEPDAIDSAQAREDFLNLVGKLPSADDRRILVLRFLFDLTNAEIAHELNISRGATRVRISRAIGRLVRVLKEARP